jgi:hypothetical protein
MARIDAVIASLPTRLPLPGLDACFAITFARRKTGLLKVSATDYYRPSHRSRDGAKPGCTREA